jgi:phage gp29-like protein
MNINLRNIVKGLVRRLPRAFIPTSRVTVIDSRSEIPSMVQGLSVDAIHSAIVEAEVGTTRSLFALYRDMIFTNSHLQSEIMKRKLAVLGDALQFMPYDKKKAEDIDASLAVDSAVANLKGWTWACSAILDGSLYPVSVVEKVYTPVGPGFVLTELIQVPYQLLDYTSGRLMIFDADPSTGNPLGTKHDPDPNRYIVHRGHLLSSPDNWGGPLRSLLFWWLLATQSREWWAKFLERFGSPFMVGKYHDDDGRSVLLSAFSLACRLGGLVISEETDVELKEAASSGSDKGYETFQSLCQREMSKLVLGQTLSSEGKSTGLGSGMANLHEEVRQDIRKYDARALAETLRDQLFTQYLRINGIQGQAPTLMWGSDSQGVVDGQVAVLKDLYEAGYTISSDSADAVSQRIGMQLVPRVAGPVVSVGPQRTFSASGGAAPELSRALRESLAPIVQIIRESRSAKDCETRLRTFCADQEPERVEKLIEDALGSYFSNRSRGRTISALN